MGTHPRNAGRDGFQYLGNGEKAGHAPAHAGAQAGEAAGEVIKLLLFVLTLNKAPATPSSAPGYADGFPALPIPARIQIPASGKRRPRAHSRAPRRGPAAHDRRPRRVVSPR